jgi:hypothetical protein
LKVVESSTKRLLNCRLIDTSFTGFIQQTVIKLLPNNPCLGLRIR